MSKQLIIIIGLPGSGKTTLTQKYKNKGYKIYDDFIDHFINYKLMKSIISGKNICINDPRLCNIKIFNFYIRIFQKYINKENIFLILFKNEPDKCIKNIKNNNNYNDITKIKKNNSINKLTVLYDINNYIDYKNKIISVYSI